VGYKINIDNSVMWIREPSRWLLALVNHVSNRLYVLDLNIAQVVCFVARDKEDGWRWHARLGHVNMLTLWKMARGGRACARAAGGGAGGSTL
jgi:hypothetical protein